MPDKELLGYLSLLAGIVGQVLYFWSLAKRYSKPHAFSWAIWGLLTAIAFFAQTSEGAGPGAWATAFTALGCFSVAIWAVIDGDKDITRSDWITFGGGLMALPVWYVTKDPLWAILLIMLIDGLGYWPTFRKSWHRPREEMLSTYMLGSLKFVFALMAMRRYSAVTTIYPVFIIAANTAFVGMAMWRRRVLSAGGQ